MQYNRKGLGFGIFLLTIGIVWLLWIAHIVTWSTLNALITLWPLVLIAMGIGFIFRSNGIIRTATWVVLLAAVICYGYFAPVKSPVIFDGREYKVSTTTVALDKQPQTEKGELTLNFGAMKVNLDSDTTKLLDASVNDMVRHHEDTKDNGKTAFIKFDMEDGNIIHLGSLGKLQSDLHLSKDVSWDIKLNTGAIDGDFDMSELKVDKLDVDIGASTLKLDMGSWNTVVDIDTGASDINITLPADTGMKVRLDGALNGTNFEHWNKDDNWYYSPDYDSMKYKIEARVKSGVGNLTIENR